MNALLVKMVCIEEAGGCLDRIAGMVGGTDYSCFFSSSVCAVHEGSALGNVYLTGGEGEAVREAVGLTAKEAVGLTGGKTAHLTAEQAAHLAGLDEVVSGLGQGIHTPLGKI